MSQDDQVLSIRLRRKNTGTPWGFRMHGGAEYSNPIFIQHVNPKSLAYRQGLRINDRLLAVGNTPTHNLTHEQVKMEIIRAGNELDFVVQRNMAAVGLDQPDSRPVKRVQQQAYPDQPDEEPSDYRSGYTNPKVQSRSFKILQESLNYTEAGEEGIVKVSGHTPGEGVVLRAYNEGKRRMQELAEINPHNFITESPIYERGQNLLKCSEEDEAIIAKLKCSYRSDEPQVASSKSFTSGSGSGESPQTQGSQAVDLAGSSCLAPAAAQQRYLQQAHAYYGNEQAPVIQTVVHQPVQSAKSPVQQYVQAEAHQVIHSQPQQVVHAQTQQQPPRRRERKRPQREQQADAQKIQSPVAVPQSNGFIPATDTVSSVAEDLNLRYAKTGVPVGAQVKKAPAGATQVVVQSGQSGVQTNQTVLQTSTQQNTQVVQITQIPVVETKPTPKQEVSTQSQVVQRVVASTPAEPKTAPSPVVVQSAQGTAQTNQTVVQTVVQTSTQKVIQEEPVLETKQDSKQEVSTQIQAVEHVDASAPAESKSAETSSVVVQTAQSHEQISQPVAQTSTKQDVKVEQTDQQPDLVTKQDTLQEVSTQVNTTTTEEVVQTGTVELSVSESPVEEVKTAVDSVDATVEPTGDVIREYGERMAETVMSESLLDASQGKKDAVDGSSNSKAGSTNETVKQEVTPSPAVEVVDEIQAPEPTVNVSEQESKVEDGKSEMKPTVEPSQTSVVSEQAPAEEVVSKSDVVSEQAPTGGVVDVESSQSEVVIESVSVTEEKPAEETSVSVSKEVSKEDVNVELTTVEAAAESSSSSENVEFSITSGEQHVATDENVGAVEEVTISGGFNTEENVEISIGGDEATFVIGGEEASSFVFEVQNEDVSAEVQENSFEVSIGEDTGEAANITLDLSADVTIDTVEPNNEESAEVSFSIESNETVETVIVEESPKSEVKEEPKKNEVKPAESTESKASAKTDTKTDNNTNAPTKKVKIIDSQGGVAARMARFNLKKK